MSAPTTTTPQRVNRPRPAPSSTVTDAALGAVIRERRLQMAMHQETLASRAGLNNSVLSRIERGERPCRFTEFVAVAEALSISALALLKLAFGESKEDAA